MDIATDITQRIRETRLRMLMGHVLLSCATAAMFVVSSVWLVASISEVPLKPMVWWWLAASLLLLLCRAFRSRTYFRFDQLDTAYWYPQFVRFLTANALIWVAAPWVLHIPDHPELSMTIVGATVGAAAMGVLMLSVELRSSQIWAVSILLSSSLYCALLYGGPVGWFSAASILIFLFVLLLEAKRTDMRIGEMLWLRFSSERIVRDRDEALAQAELLNATKSRFLANMSHEIRTPIHCVLGLGRMLEQQSLNASGEHQLKLLDQAGQHLLSLVNDVLDFSRLQENRMELHVRPVHLQSFLQDTCDLIRINAHEKGLRILADIDLPDDCWVQADPDRLRQILLNLLSNGIKFTTNGHVKLLCRMLNEPLNAGRTTDVMRRYHFEVSDTGIGIPSEELDKIFNAFHQVEYHVQHRKPGTGLGLGIARALCRAMQGDIVCTSQPGQGSRFFFTLPLPLPLPETPVVTGEKLVLLTDGVPDVKPSLTDMEGHVLLVEDNPVIAMVSTAELEAMGLQVSCVENGQQAVEWVKKHTPDLILMDCHMPVLNGFQATQAIREWEKKRQSKAVPIIAMTASSEAEDREQSQSSGMNDYLVKPFSRHALAQVVQTHLARSAHAVLKVS